MGEFDYKSTKTKNLLLEQKQGQMVLNLFIHIQ